jgi:2-polyprenyl-6-methoxyphenol hydroxylase-like FAD-dependent oxidoreductase
MTVLIAGAGIAGLTLALSCHEAGIPFLVFEQVPVLKPLGVGINVQPHAVRELFEMGLQRQLEATGIRTRELIYYSKHGKEIWREARGLYAGYNWPQFSVHRGKLHMMLLDALRERGAGDRIFTGEGVTRFSERAGTVEVELRAVDGRTRSVSGTVLVACDGIHSRIRAQLYPAEGAPVWSGAVMWRGTTVAEPYLTAASVAYAGHEWQKFVTYPIAPVDPATGKMLINWIAERKFDPSAGWRREDYSRAGDLADFLPQFAGWRFDWLDIPALIRGAEHVYEYPMVDRDPLERWTHSRVTLAGDAAHPMYPIGSNGASQAILDARVLTRRLLDHGVTAAALESYESERRPATSRVVLANRGNGPDQVMQIVEERCGGVFGVIDEVLSRDELAEIAGRYKKVAGMDVEALNARPSTLPPRRGH